MQANWLKISRPVLTEPFTIIQDIGVPETKQFNLLQNLNFGVEINAWFISVSLFSMVFICFLSFISSTLSSMRQLFTGSLVRNQMRTTFFFKKVISSCLELANKFACTSSPMRMFLLVFNLYLWFCMLLIVNTTKTNKVESTNNYNYSPAIISYY